MDDEALGRQDKTDTPRTGRVSRDLSRWNLALAAKLCWCHECHVCDMTSPVSVRERAARATGAIMKFGANTPDEEQ